MCTLLHGATNALGFLTPNLDAAARWWLIAAVYGAAAVLIVIFYGMQLYRSKTTSTLDPSLSGSD